MAVELFYWGDMAVAIFDKIQMQSVVQSVLGFTFRCLRHLECIAKIRKMGCKA
jgi:hypothetical protein